jgi:phosphatidylserine/phosphatidylglycerophosphate/cardiolipin synthase-like enzyme
MDDLPEEEVKLVVSGLDDFGSYGSLDHAIQELILPASRYAAQDFYIVSPFLIPDLITPMKSKDINKSASERGHSLLKGWFRDFVDLDGTRINIITNNLTYNSGDDSLCKERRMFAKIVLDSYDKDHMVSVYQIAEDQYSQMPSGIHAKAIVSGRRAAYLGSGNISRAGFAYNIEFGALFLGYHEMVGELLETCRKLASSKHFESVYLDDEGELYYRQKIFTLPRL